MRKRTVGLIAAVLFIMIIIAFFAVSLRHPEKEGRGANLGNLTCIAVGKFGKRIDNVTLTEKENECWKNTRFRIAADDEYPGETPDYEVILFTENKQFTAMYN